jgi:hypothetical protein
LSSRTISPLREKIRTSAGEKKTITIYPLTWERTETLSRQCPETSLVITDEQEDFALVAECDHVSLTSFPEGEDTHVHLRYLSVLKFYTLPDFINDVRDKLAQDWTLVIVTKRSDELRGVLKDERIPFVEAPDRIPANVTIVEAEQRLFVIKLQSQSMESKV